MIRFVGSAWSSILTCHGYDHDHQGGCPHKEAALALGLTLELADFCCEPPVGYTREQFLKAGFQISVWPLPSFHTNITASSFSRKLFSYCTDFNVAVIVYSQKRGRPLSWWLVHLRWYTFEFWWGMYSRWSPRWGDCQKFVGLSVQQRIGLVFN